MQVTELYVTDYNPLDGKMLSLHISNFKSSTLSEASFKSEDFWACLIELIFLWNNSLHSNSLSEKLFSLWAYLFIPLATIEQQVPARLQFFTRLTDTLGDTSI